jgi:RND family efflux transporter MFP subunit
MEDHPNKKELLPGTRRFRFMRMVIIGLAVVAALAVLLADPFDIHPINEWLLNRLGHQQADSPAGKQGKQLWTCGMHPQVIQDKPGQCPICGMNLVPLRSETPAPKAAGREREKSERKILFYRNPMNPTITSPVPAKDEMGMDYVPVYEDEAAAGQGTVVTIDPRVVQNMNVLTAPVQRRDLIRQIRTVGYLDYDQKKMVSVTTKYSGFVERVYVNYLGQPVKKGDPLFDIYSPELVQTEQEILSAKEYVRSMNQAPEDARRRAQALLEAARTRLRYWDITSKQVRRLEETGEVFRTLTVVAPSSGLLMKHMSGLEGMAIRPGIEVMHIADLSTLWLTVEVFEDQLAWVNIGSRAKATLAYFPGQEFSGNVRYIEPEVSEKTRTVRLTIEVNNSNGRLKAGMYATVVFEPVVVEDTVTVPSEAVIRTGERSVVVVALGEGRFAPRDVTIGPEGDGFVQVLSGLSVGEQVVTSAQFLIDSESSLREAIQKMISARTRRHD